MKKLKKVLLLSLVLAFSFQAASVNAMSGTKKADTPQISIWGTYSLAKVIKDPAYNHNNVQLAPEIDVACANGEGESAQIIITTGNKGIDEYYVTTADLKNENGDIFKAENVEVFHQWYSYIQYKSHMMDKTANLNADHFPSAQTDKDSEFAPYTPDALIPQKYSIKAKENHIDANANQGITFDFHVPSGTPEGTYTGNFVLNLDGKEHSIPVSLYVWAYDVTETHGISLWDISAGQDSLGEMSADFVSLYYPMVESLFKYKLSPYTFYDVNDDEIHWVGKLREYASNPSYSGSFFPDFGNNRSRITRYFAEILKACIEDNFNYFEKLRFYHQSVDEPHLSGKETAALEIVQGTTTILNDIANDVESGLLRDANGDVVNNFEKLSKELQTEIIDSIRDIPQVITTYYEGSEFLQGEVDAYSPGIARRETDKQRRMYQYNDEITGGESWCYTSLYPLYPMPCYRIDDYLHGGRILGWMRKDWNITGYLYWMVNLYAGFNWSGNGFSSLDQHVIDSYTDANHFNTSMSQFSNGDGFMFYPMAKYHADEPIPSLRIITARDGQEDFDALHEIEEGYTALASAYGLDQDALLANLDETLGMYYEKLYNGLIYYHDDADFERVRRSLGGLINAAYDGSETIITQSLSSNGGVAKLKIYSKAEEMSINGVKLTKDGDHFVYAKTLLEGENSVNIKYVINGVSKKFEFFLFNKTYAYDMSTITGITAPSKGESSIQLNNKNMGLDLNIISYGSNNAELLTTRLDFTIPLSINFNSVKNFKFTLKNTCGEMVDVKIYLKGKNGLTQIDETVVFAYETYEYVMDNLAKYLSGKNADEYSAIVLRFVNSETDELGAAHALANRSITVSNFKYSF